MKLWKADFINTRLEAIGTSCYFAERLVLAEGVEEVGADRFGATIVPVG